MAKRTYHDPLHGAISLESSDPVEALLTALIDTPAFQRLRRIRQLGPANLTFHGAETSRFTHSLGVMAVAMRVFEQLAERHEQLRDHRATVLCAALLHDIGHGPFSHTAEEVFGSQHEQWTAAIIEKSPDVRGLLDSFDPALWQQIIQVYAHTHPVPCIWQLVSSQLDCDRIDYLMRDSYFTGAVYGQLDLDRIVLALNYDPISQQLIVEQKGLAAIEHYLIVRSFMYAQIYSHAKNLSATWILEQA
ncbi:MAG: HD domain-containing protein, partial [Cyanobacteria bacterium J06576_12]